MDNWIKVERGIRYREYSAFVYTPAPRFPHITQFQNRIAARTDTDHWAETSPQVQETRYKSRRRPSGLVVSSVFSIAPHVLQGEISSGDTFCDIMQPLAFRALIFYPVRRV